MEERNKPWAREHSSSSSSSRRTAEQGRAAVSVGVLMASTVTFDSTGGTEEKKLPLAIQSLMNVQTGRSNAQNSFGLALPLSRSVIGEKKNVHVGEWSQKTRAGECI